MSRTGPDKNPDANISDLSPKQAASIFALDKSEEADLAVARDTIMPQIGDILAKFYTQVQLLPEAPKVLTSKMLIDRLKAGVSAWMANVLLRPPTGAAGEDDLKRLGVKHTQIGVPLSYIVASFGTLESLCLKVLQGAAAKGQIDSDAACAAMNAFRKRIATEQLGFVAAYTHQTSAMSAGRRTALEDQIRVRSQALRSTVSLSQTIANEIDEQQILRIVVEHILKTFAAEYCEINLLHDNHVVEPVLVVQDSRKIDPLDNDATRAVERDWRLCRVARTGTMFRVNDIDAALVKCPYQPTGMKEGCYCCVPLASGTDLLGWIHVAHNAPDSLTDEDAEILAIYGRMAGTAMASLRLIEENRRQAIVDPLTGLHNRRYFVDMLAKEQLLMDRRQSSAAMLMIDVDKFKVLNDTYGHEVGDNVLNLLADTLRECTRDVDEIARIGGDEIVVLLRDCDCEMARVIADKIRTQAAATAIPVGDENIHLKISIGIVACPEHAPTLSEAWRLADEALYQAKNAGRDKCVILSDNREKRPAVPAGRR